MIEKIDVELGPSLLSRYGKPFFGGLLIALGLMLLYITLTVNLKVDTVINNTSIALVQGATIADFLPAIKGILANGKVLNIPFWMLYITAAVSTLMIYIGAILIRLFIVGKPK